MILIFYRVTTIDGFTQRQFWFLAAEFNRADRNVYLPRGLNS